MSCAMEGHGDSPIKGMLRGGGGGLSCLSD